MESAYGGFLHECFAFADMGRRGSLDLRELKCAVAAALGIRASKLVLAQMFSHVLQVNGQTIEHIRVCEDTFTAALLPRVAKTDLLEQVRRSFKAFDVRAQGFISLASFEAACARVVPHMSQKMLYEIFREADRDGDGRVTYHDFETIFLVGEQAQHLQSSTNTNANTNVNATAMRSRGTRQVGNTARVVTTRSLLKK